MPHILKNSQYAQPAITMGSAPSSPKNDHDPLVDEDEEPDGYGSITAVPVGPYGNAQGEAEGEQQQPPPAAADEVSSQMSTPKISHLHLIKQHQAAADHRQAVLKQQLQKVKQLGRHHSADDDGSVRGSGGGGHRQDENRTHIKTNLTTTTRAWSHSRPTTTTVFDDIGTVTRDDCLASVHRF